MTLKGLFILPILKAWGKTKRILSARGLTRQKTSIKESIIDEF
jgi:hypothetical protein